MNHNKFRIILCAIAMGSLVCLVLPRETFAYIAVAAGIGVAISLIVEGLTQKKELDDDVSFNGLHR